MDEVLKNKDGIWLTMGVTKPRFPNAMHIRITAYGVHAKAHKRTAVNATLAILISALSTEESCRIIRNHSILQGLIHPGQSYLS